MLSGRELREAHGSLLATAASLHRLLSHVGSPPDSEEAAAVLGARAAGSWATPCTRRGAAAAAAGAAAPAANLATAASRLASAYPAAAFAAADDDDDDDDDDDAQRDGGPDASSLRLLARAAVERPFHGRTAAAVAEGDRAVRAPGLGPPETRAAPSAPGGHGGEAGGGGSGSGSGGEEELGAVGAVWFARCGDCRVAAFAVASGAGRRRLSAAARTWHRPADDDPTGPPTALDYASLDAHFTRCGVRRQHEEARARALAWLRRKGVFKSARASASFPGVRCRVVPLF
jgi:hypothetical protein